MDQQLRNDIAMMKVNCNVALEIPNMLKHLLWNEPFRKHFQIHFLDSLFHLEVCIWIFIREFSALEGRIDILFLDSSLYV